MTRFLFLLAIMLFAATGFAQLKTSNVRICTINTATKDTVCIESIQKCSGLDACTINVTLEEFKKITKTTSPRSDSTEWLAFKKLLERSVLQLRLVNNKQILEVKSKTTGSIIFTRPLGTGAMDKLQVNSPVSKNRKPVLSNYVKSPNTNNEKTAAEQLLGNMTIEVIKK
jgi:hypothetical protein